MSHDEIGAGASPLGKGSLPVGAVKLYHGTDIPSARSICQTGLRPGKDWVGDPDYLWILTETEQDAWSHASCRSAKSGFPPAIVIYEIPESHAVNYVALSCSINPLSRFFSLRQTLPPEFIAGMNDQEPRDG